MQFQRNRCVVLRDIQRTLNRFVILTRLKRPVNIGLSIYGDSKLHAGILPRNSAASAILHGKFQRIKPCICDCESLFYSCVIRIIAGKQQVVLAVAALKIRCAYIRATRGCDLPTFCRASTEAVILNR